MSECIWAPWRLPYIVSHKDDAGGCFLCSGRDGDDDRGNLIVCRGRHSLVVLNRYPYNNGHLLVAPLGHKASLAEFNGDEHLDCMHAMQRMLAALDRVLSPHGYNIGLNLGRVAGAGLPGHLHWHIVPRWEGDTNFMPVLAGVRVIPQSLEQLYDALRPIVTGRAAEEAQPEALAKV